jgi:hypothetical protein
MTRALLQALITVIELYTSPQWPVQNSATMTFSTIVSRFISNKQTRRDEQPSAYRVAVTGVTCSEFFFRFPRMHSFLLHKLSTIWSTPSFIASKGTLFVIFFTSCFLSF